MESMLRLLAWPTLAGIALIALAAASGGEARPLAWTAAAVLVVLLCTALAAHFGSRRPRARVLGEHNARIDALVEENRRLREETQTLASELKAAREQERDARSSLRQSEERFLVAVRGANDGLWEWDLSTDTLRLSPRWKAMLGYTAEDFPDRPDALRDQLHPEDLGMVQKLLRDHIEGASNHFEYQARFRHRDGRYRWFFSRGAALRKANGKAYRVVGIDTDITRIKRVEAIVEHIAAGTADTHGDEFFRSLVRHFAGAMEVACALVTECVDQPATRVRMLAFWRAQEFQSNKEYELTGTPCEKVIHGASTCFVPTRVADVYPKEAGFESYVGVPIFGSDQRVIGHLALLDTRMMNEEILVEPLFRIFCARAGAEIERRQALERLRDLAA